MPTKLTNVNILEKNKVLCTPHDCYNSHIENHNYFNYGQLASLNTKYAMHSAQLLT
jgi:hypothetical protein